MRLSQYSLVRKLPALSTYLVSIATVVTLAATPAYAAKPTTKKGGGNSGADDSTSVDSNTNTPLEIDYENYNFRNLSGDNSCLGEDDHVAWKAIGDLQPGESFTFTPQYPACNGHAAAISVSMNWEGSELELSSSVPYRDFANADVTQTGKEVIAPNIGNSAQLCMFPAYREDYIYYTITVTNVGTTTASNIEVDGHSDNDWTDYYYSRCVNADADGDGWNDSLEHTMANLVRYVGYIDDEFQMYPLWGTNYLKATSDTLAADDEIDSNPADFNDDGIVDMLDLNELNGYLGQGNGIPLERISPNPSDDEYFHRNTFPWRRYDLDGDGYVSQTDADIIETLLGEATPMVEDIIAPTARVIAPAHGSSIEKGRYHMIKGHVWDNAAISRVEYVVNGKVECTATDAAPEWGMTSPFYNCYWQVPKRQGLHEIEIRVYDAAGNMTVSDIAAVSAN